MDQKVVNISIIIPMKKKTIPILYEGISLAFD